MMFILSDKEEGTTDLISGRLIRMPKSFKGKHYI